MRYPDVTAIAARSLQSRAEAGMVSACASCLSMPCSSTRSSISRHSSWSAGRDFLPHLLEDVEEVGALSHEYLRLGAAQVRVAQGGDVGPQAPVGQGSHQAEEFCPEVLEDVRVDVEVGLGQVQFGLVDILRRLARPGQADDPVYWAVGLG